MILFPDDNTSEFEMYSLIMYQSCAFVSINWLPKKQKRASIICKVHKEKQFQWFIDSPGNDIIPETGNHSQLVLEPLYPCIRIKIKFYPLHVTLWSSKMKWKPCLCVRRPLWKILIIEGLIFVILSAWAEFISWRRKHCFITIKKLWKDRLKFSNWRNQL